MNRSPLSQILRGTTIERYKRTCQYCDTPGSLYNGPDGEAWWIDHIMPHSKGGTDLEENLTLACASCNRMKRDSLPPEDWNNRQTKKKKSDADPGIRIVGGDHEDRLEHALRALHAGFETLAKRPSLPLAQLAYAVGTTKARVVYAASIGEFETFRCGHPHFSLCVTPDVFMNFVASIHQLDVTTMLTEYERCPDARKLITAETLEAVAS